MSVFLWRSVAVCLESGDLKESLFFKLGVGRCPPTMPRVDDCRGVQNTVYAHYAFLLGHEVA